MPCAPLVATRHLSRFPGAANFAAVVKLLVLAQTPPPLHGQSAMVRAMLDGLEPRPELTLHHVNLRLSRDQADIGRWRPAKAWRTVTASLQAIVARFRHGCDTLYYVPAPGKRGALYRDWLALALCRPFFPRLVLHWHAAGLAEWLAARATGLERAVTRIIMGRADLSLVLAETLRADAEYLHSRQVAVVPNGIDDPGPPAPRPISRAPWQALFLGLCSEEKGVFAAAEAVMEANRRAGGTAAPPRFRLVAAGSFPDESSALRFRQLIDAHPYELRHAGFVEGAAKSSLFAASDCLIFPTRYAAEGQPLAVLEALAHDLPVLTTHWRGLPGIVTADCGRLVPPGDAESLVAALLALQENPPGPGACRERFLQNFMLAHHLDRLASALGALEPTLTDPRPG